MNPNPPCDQFPLPCICCRQRAQLEIDLKSSEVFFRKIAAKTGLELGKVAHVFSTLKVIAIQELREKQRFHLRGLAMFTVKTTPAQKKKTRQKSTAKKAPVKEARPSKTVLSVEAASGRAFYCCNVFGDFHVGMVGEAKNEEGAEFTSDVENVSIQTPEVD